MPRERVVDRILSILLVVFLAVLAWALTANLIWWIAPPRRLEQAARS